MAGLSIYNAASDWERNTPYNLYDIYLYGGKYYYAISKHNSGGIFNPNYSDGITSYNGKVKPYFFWKPSYNSNVSIKPVIKKNQFGDGYSQSSPDGINNILLPFSLTFDKRTDAEARAILHFLHLRKGSESFVFVPPFPYNTNKLFKCEQLEHSQIFANNHTVNAIFNEVVV